MVINPEINLNKSAIILIIIGIVVLIATWSYWSSHHNSTQLIEAQQTPKYRHPSSDEVKAVASQLICKNQACEQKSLTECECDSSNTAQKQITAMMLTGLTAETTVEHMFMMGYDPVDKEKFKKDMPLGHPPIGTQKSSPEGH